MKAAKVILFLLALTSLFLVSCIKISERTEKILDIPPAEPPPIVPIVHSPEIESLIEKSKSITSYKYTFDARTNENYDAYIKDYKIRKSYAEVKKLNEDVYYTDVYLNTYIDVYPGEQQVATVICAKAGTLCESSWLKAYTIDYNKEEIAETPLDLLDAIPAEAKKVGEVVFNGRPVVVVEFPAHYPAFEGYTEQLSIDTYYGFPMQQILYKTTDESKEPVVKHTFTAISVNNVQTPDVTIPQNYVLVVE